MAILRNLGIFEKKRVSKIWKYLSAHRESYREYDSTPMD